MRRVESLAVIGEVGYRKKPALALRGEGYLALDLPHGRPTAGAKPERLLQLAGAAALVDHPLALLLELEEHAVTGASGTITPHADLLLVERMVERPTCEKERGRVKVEVANRGGTELVWLHLARHAPLQPRALRVGEEVLGLRALEDHLDLNRHPVGRRLGNHRGIHAPPPYTAIT